MAGFSSFTRYPSHPGILVILIKLIIQPLLIPIIVPIGRPHVPPPEEILEGRKFILVPLFFHWKNNYNSHILGSHTLYASVIDVENRLLQRNSTKVIKIRNSLVWIPSSSEIKTEFQHIIRSNLIYAPTADTFYGYQLTDFDVRSRNFGKVSHTRYVFTILSITQRGFQAPFSVYKNPETYMIEAMVASLLRVSPLLRDIRDELGKMKFITQIKITIQFYIGFLAKKTGANGPNFLALRREIFIDLSNEILYPLIDFFPKKIDNGNNHLQDAVDFNNDLNLQLINLMKLAFEKTASEWTREIFEQYDDSNFPGLDENIDRFPGKDDFDTITLSITHPQSIKNVMLPKISTKLFAA